MSKIAVDRLLRIKKLLLKEQEEDYRQYKELFLRVNLDQRRKNGVTWHPVKINHEELGAGELMHVELERTTYTDLPHQFTSGKNVTLYTEREGETKEINGTIKQVQRNVMRVVMHVDELPDWCYEGKLGVNIQFDDHSYTVMQEALDEVISAKDNRVAELRDLIEAKDGFQFEPEDESLIVPGLNLSQTRAVRKVVAAKDIMVIHGPPGTGKSTSLAHAIRETLKYESQVLVCAPTNTAVDVMTEKLIELGVDVLRLGHPARMNDDLVRSSVDGRVTASPYYKEIKELRKQAEEYFRLAGKHKRTYGREEAQERAFNYSEARKCIKDARILEDYITEELFKTAQVICCTPVTSKHKALNRKKFKTLFFDEASQALEPMLWVPLLKCNRLILAGDHYQLPPVVKSQEAKNGGLDVTILDRCVTSASSVVLLNKQYRMNDLIMGFSNRWFYGNELKSDDTVANHALVNDDTSPLSISLEFIDTAGCGFDEIQNPETLSYCNPDEGRIVYQYLDELITQYNHYSNYPTLDIGIIAPYREQREWLQEHLNEQPCVVSGRHHIQVKTIDGFQGEERDVIIISLVRSNARGEIGFLSDLRRMNVAITRARKKLVLVGDSATISKDAFYKQFLDYCEEKGIYRTAWEFSNL